MVTSGASVRSEAEDLWTGVWRRVPVIVEGEPANFKPSGKAFGGYTPSIASESKYN
jgi:hypothetical protein